MSEEAEQHREEINLANKKTQNLADKFQLDLDREKHATQTFKDEAAISKAVIEEKQKEIRTLSSDALTARENIDTLHDKLTNVREILEETNVQLLRTKNTSKEWQARAYEAETRLNELSFAHKKEKKMMEEQVRGEWCKLSSYNSISHVFFYLFVRFNWIWRGKWSPKENNSKRSPMFSECIIRINCLIWTSAGLICLCRAP